MLMEENDILEEYLVLNQAENGDIANQSCDVVMNHLGCRNWRTMALERIEWRRLFGKARANDDGGGGGSGNCCLVIISRNS